MAMVTAMVIIQSLKVHKVFWDAFRAYSENNPYTLQSSTENSELLLTNSGTKFFMTCTI
jgi:hypothetical protein